MDISEHNMGDTFSVIMEIVNNDLSDLNREFCITYNGGMNEVNILYIGFSDYFKIISVGNYTYIVWNDGNFQDLEMYDKIYCENEIMYLGGDESQTLLYRTYNEKPKRVGSYYQNAFYYDSLRKIPVYLFDFYQQLNTSQWVDKTQTVGLPIDLD